MSRLLNGVFLYVVPGGTAYVLYTRKRDAIKRRAVPYKRVQIKTATETKGEGIHELATCRFFIESYFSLAHATRAVSSFLIIGISFC